MSSFKNIMQYTSFIHRAHFRSVKASFVHIPSIEQCKRDIFYGPFENCKAVYSINCILVSIVIFYTFVLLNGQMVFFYRRVFLLLI
jgi:hypothetical protein